MAKKMNQQTKDLVIKIGNETIRIGSEKPISTSGKTSGDSLIKEIGRAARQGVFRFLDSRQSNSGD